GHATNKVRVVPVHVAETFLGSFAAQDGFGNLVIEFSHALSHGGLAQGLLALVIPRAQIEILSVAKFSHPRGATLVEILVIPAQHVDEVNRGYAAESMQVTDFVLEIFNELPFAIFAFQIRRRKAGEQ